MRKVWRCCCWFFVEFGLKSINLLLIKDNQFISCLICWWNYFCKILFVVNLSQKNFLSNLLMLILIKQKKKNSVIRDHDLSEFLEAFGNKFFLSTKRNFSFLRTLKNIVIIHKEMREKNFQVIFFLNSNLIVIFLL